MTQPPALSKAPQFTTEYWDKVPRALDKVKLVRITNLNDDFVEFAFDNGSAFQRRKDSLNADIKLHANMEVFVQFIKSADGAIVTGLHVPTVGWAFLMTSEELAEYAQTIATLMNQQRHDARASMLSHLANALLEELCRQCEVTGPEAETMRVYVDGPISLVDLALAVVKALEKGPVK